MKKSDFFNEIKDIFELDIDVDEETLLHVTSILILNLIVLLDERFNMHVKASELRGVNSVGDIMSVVGLEKFQ